MDRQEQPGKMPADDSQLQKQLIRDQILERRSRLTPQEVRRAAAAVAWALKKQLHRLSPYPAGRPLHIGAYAAIRNELDLALCWPMLQAWPAILYFPAVSDGRLLFGAVPPDIRPEQYLVPGHFGVPEPPVDNRLEKLPELDLILMPGLAFDRMGHRIGWGKAYYDRLLAGLPPQTVRIGVAYTFQILPQLPQAAHDQAVQIILTPDGCLSCDHR